MSKLMPFRIPSGWTVEWNMFFEDPDPKGDDNESEDMLWLTKHDAQKRLSIDLGHYGQGKSGAFRLVMLDGGWDNIIRDFRTQDRNELVPIIEQWLENA